MTISLTELRIPLNFDAYVNNSKHFIFCTLMPCFLNIHYIMIEQTGNSVLHTPIAIQAAEIDLNSP